MKFFIATVAFLSTFSMSSASLAADLAPILALLVPTLEGANIGIQIGAGNIKEAVQNAGVVIDQIANAAADVADNTLVGAGQTAGEVPAGVDKTLQTIDNSPGVVGSLDRAVLGK